MIQKILYRVFGTRNQRLLKGYLKVVQQINQLETTMVSMSDSELQNKTNELREKVRNGESLQSVLPESFAICREASKRVLEMRHFDVQLIGGMVLNAGKIAEMKTGEGKTLVATLAVYLNALAGNGVHVVTVNDYLAKRDASEMSKLYNFLGLSVGVNLPDMSHEEKKHAYQCDITYGTNNEFGFDYLRDNMVFDINDKVQRPLAFAVVDEVDSILIDEARTPLIISGPAEGSEELYVKLNQVPKLLTKQEAEESNDGDFWVDEKNHNVILSEAGHIKVEEILLKMKLLEEGDSLYNAHNISLMHHLLAALKAHYIYLRDQHYVIQENEVIIVDEFTGRLMHGRRWSDGLHQAVEAKEGVTIQRENQTLASITFQNYFRMYKKLSGMTGTADTEAYEFQEIYNLETVVIPTNKPMIRNDHNDKIYMNLQDKYNAIIEDIKECHSRHQPVLVGTTSVENSEILSQLLAKAKLKHEVLNAKQHAREADIIVQAGRPGGITVATNMAGRGTDIILGGNPKPEIASIKLNSNFSNEERDAKIKEVWAKWIDANKKVLESGGLAIIGTERHESRRIDNQLRGRSGRQGDKGSSRFYLSLDDPLLRIFGGERMRSMMQRFGMKEGEAIEHKWLSRSIESAQRKVEGHNFDIRKQLLEYDNVFNEQRSVIYKQRDELLTSQDLSETAAVMIKGVVGGMFDNYIPPRSTDDIWDISGLEKFISDTYLIHFNVKAILLENPNINEENIKNQLIDLIYNNYHNKMVDFAKKINDDINGFVTGIIGGERSSWNITALDDFCAQNSIILNKSFTEIIAEAPDITQQELIDKFNQTIGDMGKMQVMRFERSILLQHIDYYWKEHLTQLEQLRQGIHLRGYAQKDPKREFQTEAFGLFAQMLDNIKNEAVKALVTVNIQGIDDIPTEDSSMTQDSTYVHQDVKSFLLNNSQQRDNTSASNPVSAAGRNAKCPCGSGKKYKHCHGKLA